MKGDFSKNNKKQNRTVDKMVDQSLRELGTMRFVTWQFLLSWKSLLVVMFLAGMVSTVLLVTDWFPISLGQQQTRIIVNTAKHQFESESGQKFGSFNSNKVSVRVLNSSGTPTPPPDPVPTPPPGNTPPPDPVPTPPPGNTPPHDPVPTPPPGNTPPPDPIPTPPPGNTPPPDPIPTPPPGNTPPPDPVPTPPPGNTPPPDPIPTPPGQCPDEIPGFRGKIFPDVNSDGCVDWLDVSMVLSCLGYGDQECFINIKNR